MAKKVYKVKYFPTINFLNSHLGSKPSYVWSICAAKSLLISGCIWKIGKGDGVRINQDKWVPTFRLPQSLPPNYVIQDDLKVNMLMHQHNRAWDVDMIQSIFPPFVANATVQIPLLLPRGWEDKLYGQVLKMACVR